jgi:hypothetical protein
MNRARVLATLSIVPPGGRQFPKPVLAGTEKSRRIGLRPGRPAVRRPFVPTPDPFSPPGLRPTPAPLVSLCLIARNEAVTLGRCLESVRELADELIVVDTGSADATQEVARRAGARVISCAWEDDFSRARNRALDEARGSWILVLDADEFLLPEAREALRALVRTHTPAAGSPAVAFQLVQNNTEDPGRTGMLVGIVRLFPRLPTVRYEWPIHEQVVTSLQRAGVPVVATEIAFIHTGYADPARRLDKQRRNLAILQAQLAAGSAGEPLTWFLLGGAQLDLGDSAAAYSSYAECSRRCPPDSELGRGARVRLATCLLNLRRYDEAIAGMPLAYDPSWHPELLNHRGAAEAGLGRLAEARRWHERALACTPQTFVPPCNLADEKARALLFLGGYWKEHGQPGLAISLLRAARACHREGRDLSPASLAELYRAHGVA